VNNYLNLSDDYLLSINKMIIFFYNKIE